MAIFEKRPSHPVPKSYVLAGSKPYKVTNGDTWESVARKHGVDVRELIYANFKTGNFEEVNWYLRHYVGCRVESHNRYNWVFTSSADPGIIHIPIKQVVTLPPVATSAAPRPKLGELWAGLGKAHSGDLFVVGAHDLTAKIYNLGDELPSVKNAIINVNGFKFGLGLGGDVSAVFVIAHGFAAAQDMVGVDGEFDFDLAIGTKLGDFLKEVKGLGKVIETVEKYKKMKYLAENALHNLGIREPGIYNIPIPFAGVGLHLWGGYKFGDVSLFATGVGGIP